MALIRAFSIMTMSHKDRASWAPTPPPSRILKALWLPEAEATEVKVREMEATWLLY